MIFAEQVKNQLLSLIGEMAAVPWLFSQNPSTDFSRNRKLDFASTIQLILSMESASIKKELLDFAVYSARRSLFCFGTVAFRSQSVVCHSLQSESMARAKAGINAPLTQFQPVACGNQAEQKVVLRTPPF